MEQTTNPNPYVSGQEISAPVAKRGGKRKNTGRASGNNKPKAKQVPHRTGVDGAQPRGRWKNAPKSTQELAGFKAMLPSGLAWLGGDEWSITVEFTDVNYVAASEAHQETILSMWAGFLNSFASTERLEITTLNRVLDAAEVEELLHIPLRGDPFDVLRSDRNRIISRKLASSSGNTATSKYLTITTSAPTREKAEASLERRAKEIKTALEALPGCRVRMLPRAERINLLARILRPRELLTFREDTFDRNSTKALDYVAPNGVTTDGATSLVMHNGVGDTYSKVLWVRDYPVWMTDAFMKELMETKCELTVSFHLEAYDKAEGAKLVDRQIAELEMEMIRERRRAAKQKIGEDMVPRRLTDALTENRELRKELVSSNEKLFSTVMVIAVTADTAEELEQSVHTVAATVRKQSMQVETLRNMQKEGLMTALPIGRRAIPMRRTMTTSAAAVIVPFTTQDMLSFGGHWYGMNVSSANVVIADRTQTQNGNGFILGTSGSGKGVFAKAEIISTFLNRPDDDIIIIDPDREYAPLVEALQGQRIEMHVASEHSLNPLDLDMSVDMGVGDPLAEKVLFVLSLLELMVGGTTGLDKQQKALLDRLLLRLFRTHIADPSLPMPTFITLHEALIADGSAQARELADALSMYTDGSLATFSRHTNVDTDSRVISWDISKLSDDLKPYGMLVLLEQIWRRVAANRERKKRTWVYVDEFHLLLLDKQSAEFFRKFWAIGRKWGAIPTGITQNIETVLQNASARSMLANSAFLAVLGQNQTDADSLTELMKFSEEQRRYFENVQPGQGLLIAGSTIVGFDGAIEPEGVLYDLYETTFKEG